MTKEFEPRIYVACLAAYNNGHLHGVWVDATQDLQAMQDQVNAMLQASPITGAEEHAIHDYDDFGGAFISEYSGLSEVRDIANFLAEHGRLGALTMKETFGDRVSAKAMLDQYAGCYKSVEAFAEDCAGQWYDIPDRLCFYIDYQLMARNLQLGGDIDVIEEAFEVVHIFWRR